MKKQRILSAIIGFCLLFCMLLIPADTVRATDENQNILEARNGILQIMYAGQNANEEYVDLFGGTGFLIGTEDNAQYVITNHHVVEPLEYMSEDEQKTVWDFLGISYDQKIKTKIHIILKRDSYIEAEVVQQSMEADFAILKMEKPIYGGRSPLVLGDSDALQPTFDVYALGFPGIVQAMQDDKLYTSDDVTVTQGTVSKLADSVLVNSPIPCVNHSATITNGNSGGPLLDSTGVVVGVNRHTDMTGTYFYSVQINEVKDVLDMEGIEYLTSDSTPGPATSDSTPGPADDPAEDPGEEITPTPTEAPVEDPNEELFEELQTAIQAANKADRQGMTDESVAALDKAIAAANDVYADKDSQESDIKGAISDLKEAQENLKEKGISPAIIIGIAAAVIVVIIVVVALIAVSSGRKKKAMEAEQERKRRAAMGGMNAMGGGAKPNPNPYGGGQGASQFGQQRPPVVPPVQMGDDGSAATGILNDGSSETTVLGGQNIPGAYLIRKKNGERITISKAVFKVGKERRKVDYCIADNTNISRTHADIVYRNGEFLIVDNHATNGTFVNGTSVVAGGEQRLKNSDVIRLADEEFQFRTL